MMEGPSGTVLFVYDASGQLAAEYGGTVEETRTQYLTVDHLGSTRMVTDGAGAVIARYDYLPFGQDILNLNGRAGVLCEGGLPCFEQSAAVTQKFTGKERDAETGRDYFGARYYYSPRGRFTSPDPLLNSGRPWEPQSWNRYAYVANNPLRYTDPFGLFKFAANCNEDNDAKCRAVRDRFREAFANLKKAAAGLEKGSKERRELEGVIKRIGEEGEGSTRIAFGDDTGITNGMPNLGQTDGTTITINFDALDAVVTGRGLSESETAAFDASIVGHEGKHLPGNFFARLFRYTGGERGSLRAQSTVFQGLSTTDRVIRLWDESWAKVDREQLRQSAIDRELKRQNEQKIQENQK